MWKEISADDTEAWNKSGSGILFTDGSKVLLLKRSSTEDDAQGTWACAGGKSEKGESLDKTAKRECKEEIGVCPKCKKLKYYDLVRDKFLFRTYLCLVDEPFECTIDDEHDEYRWVNLESASKLNLHDGIQHIWSDVLKTIKNHSNIKKTNFKEWLDQFFGD